MKTNTYERGTYYFFDCLNWRKVAKVCFFYVQMLKSGLCLLIFNNMSAPVMCQIFANAHRSVQKQLISLIGNLLNLVRDFYNLE